jgi:branched-chain amino acid aminotransferase
MMLNHKGEVAECTGDNIFIVRGKQVATPPLEAGILAGITRDAVLELAFREGMNTAEVPLTKHDVYVADEVFLTGSAAEVVPVVKIDGRTIGDGKPGPVSKLLKVKFADLVRQPT